MRGPVAALSLLVVLTGCQSIGRDRADTCRARPVQYAVGLTRSPELEHELLMRSNSTQIRWTTPEMIVTTSYVFGQLTVDLTAEDRIYRLYCS